MTAYTFLCRYRYYALALLFSANLLNYVDRQVIYAVFPLIKTDLNLSDAALGSIGSAFMIFYMISAPLFGWLGDRMMRVRMASYGLLAWSIATAWAGLANNYTTLLTARSMVGIGEASFGTVSPGVISDYYSKSQRGRIVALYYLAIPLGSALGYLLGGTIGQFAGWHAAFMLVGVPGILLTIPLWILREPKRGESEGSTNNNTICNARYRNLADNRSFMINTLAMAAMTFAMGGLAQWAPTFLYREHHMNIADVNTAFGAVTVAAGILGTLAGGWLGDFFQKSSESGYLAVSAFGFLIGAPMLVLSLTASTVLTCFIAIFIAEFFLFFSTGPLNTVILNVTKPEMRAMAFALNIFIIHALGDAVSPVIIGWLSDLAGIRNALMITPCAILVASILSFFCMRYMAQDIRRVNC
ncbi:MAG TPA: MFS transporter [Dissulfurispiraceae bacterium]|nr:MFS transporter [Dissulfurispiraceae bacterium]